MNASPLLTDLLDNHAEHEATSLAASRAEYSAILARADAPDPSDAKRLLDLAAELGIDRSTAKLNASHAAETARHRREVASLVAHAEQARTELANLEADTEAHAAALAAAGSPQALTRAAEAAVALVHAKDEKLISDYLRHRGWRLMPTAGWSDPTNPGSHLARNLARDTQIERDTKPIWESTASRFAAGAAAAISGKPHPG